MTLTPLEQLLRSRLADAEATVERLKTQLAAREAALQAELAAERERLGQEIAARDTLLLRITSSRGWRLLNRWRSLRRRARDAVEVLLGREYEPALLPIHQVRPVDLPGRWESTGNDPQFQVLDPWPYGWARVSIRVEPEAERQGHARLYVDRGTGYREADSYELGEVGREQTCYVPLGPDAVRLRLDPLDVPGRFRLTKFVLKRVSALEAKRANRSRSAPRRAAPLKGFLSFSLSRARQYRRTHGRLPRLRELPRRVSNTVGAWVESSQRPSDRLKPLDPYDAWLEVNGWNSRREGVLRNKLSKLADPPRLSVVMPISKPRPGCLDRAIESVVQQVYRNWELCIADHARSGTALRPALLRWAARESRIRLGLSTERATVTSATNRAAELSSGTYIVLMDQDDELSPDALGEVALYLSEHPETDAAYSDNDTIDAAGRRFAPQFKPDWSPELLLSRMYMGHVRVLERSLFFRVGGRRVGLEGSDDYDLALRATENARHVGHIPKILYHRRALPGLTASSVSGSSESFARAQRVVEEALGRRGVRATVSRPDWAVKARCGAFALRFPDDGPRVAILVPTSNEIDILRTCLGSLEKTSYRNYEVVIIGNTSDDPTTRDVLARTPYRVVRSNAARRSSFAAVHNGAVLEVAADLVLFLDNDTQVLTPGWLSQMVGYLGLPGVGAVGARLLFPDGRVGHAGIAHDGYDGMAGPTMKLDPAGNPGGPGETAVVRNCSAVPLACMLTRRELFLRTGGFDEARFAGAYGDMDYCYRLVQAGHRIVYCPTAELIHHDGGSRASAAEQAAFRTKWGGWRDPYSNPNLSLAPEGVAIDARTIAPSELHPIRALMCGFNLNWEGAAQSQYEIAIRLKERGVIDPVVYAPEDGPLRRAYEEQGIQVEVCPHPLAGIFDLATYERAIEGFAERVLEWGAELVYGNTLQTFYAIDTARHLGLPSIWNPRESEPWQTYFDYLVPAIAARALQCFAYPYKVVFVANATRVGCLPLNTHHNFVTIHNGLDRERFGAALWRWPRTRARARLDLSNEQLALLLLGTVCERKGQVDLVEAIGRLDDHQARRIRCLIVGDRPGEYSERLKAAWAALPPSRRSSVQILPETPDTALYYSAADLFVCSSRIESYPRVILEAMAAGLPIITTPVYGIAEQVRENWNALFYDPGDTQALASAIVRLLEEPSLRCTLAGNSPHMLDTLADHDAMVRAYATVFREAWLSGRPRACAASSA